MYQITERALSNAPSLNEPCTDPVAQATRQHSGVYDLRDTRHGNVICATSVNLPALRRLQAKLNTSRWLD